MAASDRQTPRPGMDGTRPLDVGQSALSSKENKTYQVIVNGLMGEEVVIDLCNTEEQMQKMTVLQLKEKILQRVPGLDDVERLRLIFTDKMLGEDSTLLCSYGIHHKSVIHLVMKLPGGGSHPPPSKPPSEKINRMLLVILMKHSGNI